MLSFLTRIKVVALLLTLLFTAACAVDARPRHRGAAAYRQLRELHTSGASTMRFKTTGFLVCLAATLASAGAACGGGQDSDTKQAESTRAATAEATEASILEAKDQPDEDALRDAAEEFSKAFAQGDATKSYTYNHESFRDKCPFAKWVATLALARGFLGDTFKNAEPRVEKVRIEGNKGYVAVKFYLDERPLEFGGNSGFTKAEDAWLWEAGKWWTAAFDPDPAPCEIDFGSTSTPSR